MLEELLEAGLVLAKEQGFDVFTAVALNQLPSLLTTTKLQFVEGTGVLRFYLFNWEGRPMTADEIAFVPV